MTAAVAPFMMPTRDQAIEFLTSLAPDTEVGPYSDIHGCPIHTILTHFNPDLIITVGGVDGWYAEHETDRLSTSYGFPAWMYALGNKLSNLEGSPSGHEFTAAEVLELLA